MLRLKEKLGRAGTIALLSLHAFVVTSLVLSAGGVAFSQQDPAQQQGGGQGTQDGKLDINVDVGNHTDTVWYTQWWMWAIGLGVFLVVVIALTNRGRAA